MANQPLTFREAAARTRKSNVYQIPFATPGASQTQQLNNTGYLAEMYATVYATVDVTTAGTVTDTRAAQTNFLPRIVLRSPAGEIIHSTSSKDLIDFNKRLYAADVDSIPGKVAWTPGALGTYNVVLPFRIPIAINDGMNFTVGELMRQISNNFFYLDLTFAQASDLIGSGTCVATLSALSVSIGEVYYDSVPVGANVVPPNFTELIRYRSQQFAPLTTGQNVVSYATNPVLLDTMFRLVNTGAADGTVSNLSYIQATTNFGTEIDNRTGFDLARDNYLAYQKAMPAGVYIEDFSDDLGVVNATHRRDWINSSNVANLQFNVQYAGAPGASANYIQAFFREMVQAQ